MGGRGAELTRTLLTREHIVLVRRTTMLKQFESPKAAKLEDEAVSGSSSEKRIEIVAEKAAEKSSKTVQEFDSENRQIFST
jgi:hypothetical protein